MATSIVSRRASRSDRGLVTGQYQVDILIFAGPTPISTITRLTPQDLVDIKHQGGCLILYYIFLKSTFCL